jgi:hypothetical protein
LLRDNITSSGIDHIFAITAITPILPSPQR